MDVAVELKRLPRVSIDAVIVEGGVVVLFGGRRVLLASIIVTLFPLCRERLVGDWEKQIAGIPAEVSEEIPHRSGNPRTWPLFPELRKSRKEIQSNEVDIQRFHQACSFLAQIRW